ncbi:signal peptidase I [Alkalicoccus urumqiensis]|uniref:Signal peptidase I n=1 Tax=Alkalicoccus urumqiensis TaxID=1548213 RepID=A0A2P6MG32_ALKUR|nr:signal peptidase I [Alkalicoccus urumqiensis]PRO65248.1 signal peptidase I [Alkalicoccus urumqiensis]
MDLDTIYDWAKTIMLAAVAALMIRLFFITPVIVEGQSMMPTLEDDSRMIINKVGYMLDEPDRFDVVVFNAEEGKDYIKRIIGLPGEQIAYENNRLYINGMEMEEPFLQTAVDEIETADFELPLLSADQVVPEDHVFVMGDNRSNSRDSRQIGFVPVSEIVGEANVVFWPPEHIQMINKQ